MKIVIVLCSLATFAIAVPVFEENVFESSLNNQLLSPKRVKKSPVLDITPGLSPEYGVDQVLPHSSKKLGPGTSVAAKSFRRPIIIKRKLGYHVYRDSDEEMAYAEPGEKCTEQVKFKICDPEPASSSTNGMKRPFKCVNNYKTDNEMENSIKMARKAVEHLQKDLKRMENFSPKMANPHIEDIESNNGLHHDIEIAREALEHIEHNFESVNLKVNKVNELQIPKSQEVERLTRWREAIENIHKNFEIVKNIEDAFKTDDQFSVFRSDNQKTVELEEPTNTELKFHVHNKITNDNLENDDKVNNEDKTLKSASNNDEIAEFIPKTENIDNIDKDVADDMFLYPTENREKKVQLHSDSLKSEINYKDASRNDASEIESTKINKKYANEGNKWQFLKSVPELQSDPMLPTTLNVHITDDQQSQKQEVGMRSSESQNEKLQFNDYQEEPKYASTRLDIENNSDDTKSQFYKSVPETNSLPIETLPLEKGDITNDEESHKTEASMRSSERQNEKMQLNENQEVQELLTMGLNNDRHPEERTSQHSKSVPELAHDSVVSIPTEEFVITADPHAHTQEASMRSSDSKHDKLQLNDYQEEPKYASTSLGIENNSDDAPAKFFKFVPDLQPHPSESMPWDKDHITNEQQSHREEANMRSSESRNDKLQLNEYQEEPKHAKSRLDIENNSHDITSQSFKSVPSMNPFPIEALPLKKEEITNDGESHKIEANMRSSDNQNEKMQSNENQEVHELPTMGLDNERHPEERTWKYSKSVPELVYDSVVSMPTEEFVITADPHTHTVEASMRSSDSQNEKWQLNDYQEEPKYASTRFDIENNSGDTPVKVFKSVLELQPYSSETMPSDKGHIINNQQSHIEEASMRSSETQNEKLELNKYQDDPKEAHSRLDIENNSDDTTSQSFKSVPEMKPFSIEALPLEKEDITNDEESHKTEANMRSSDNQNEKMKSNENQEGHGLLTMGLGNERHPEERTWQYSKSVPELAYDSMISMPTDEVVITNDPHAHTKEASIRSSDNQNEKWQLNDYQEEPKYTSTRLDVESNSDDTTAQLFKSVSEPQPYPSESMPSDKGHITNNQQSHREEASMRSSETQNEKLELNKYQEEPKEATSRLDIENNSDDTTFQSFKSVPEMKPFPIEALSLEKEDITNDEEYHKTESSMRSSGNQNDKMQSNENQEVHERLSMGLDDVLHPEKRTWQYSKSVPKSAYDSMVLMPTEEVVIIDDPYAHREEASMRLSDSQNEKLQLNDYHEEPKLASKRLGVEHNSDDTTAQLFKSVSELQPYPSVSMPSDKSHITNDQQSDKEEVSMRTSDSQSEKMQPIENQEVHKLLPSGLDIERHPEGHTWQYSKSVPELAYDSMVSMPTDELVITDDPYALREEMSMRSSESQNEKLELNNYQEEPKFASTSLNIENNSDDTTGILFKSVPELQPHPSKIMPSSKERTTSDQQFHREKASMRSSDSQSEKMQSIENQKVHELLPLELEIERHPEGRTWQDSKSVPELAYDSMLSMPTDEVVIADDPHAHREKASMRSSESQNEKNQLSENQEVYELFPMGLVIEHHPEDRTWQNSKSVPELIYDSMVSMPTEEVVITDDPHAHAKGSSMRSSESQNEKWQLNDYQEEPKFASTKMDIENNSDDITFNFFKSVPELQPYPAESMLSDKEHINYDQQSHKEEASMRSSDSQNEKMQSNEYKEEPKYASTRLDIENNSDDTIAQSFKSVPELPFNPTISIPTDNNVGTDGQNVQKEEASMRSSESQNEKLQLDEYKEEPKYASTRLDVEENSDDTTAQSFKSVPELPFNPTISIPTDNNVGTDSQNVQKEEASMRSSESQNEKLQLDEYKEEPKYASTRLDVEENSDDTTAQSFKSVPELPFNPTISIPTDNNVGTDGQNVQKEEASMRSSESQNEKLQLDEYKEEPKYASTRLDIENNSDDTTVQSFKSVPEVPFDPTLSMPTENVVSTHDHNDQKEEMSMRSSESQNQKLQLNEYQEEPKHVSTRLDIETNSDDATAESFKSVPELQPFPIESLPLEEEDITNDQQSHKKEASMRSSENQNEKMHSNENQEAHELLPTGLDIERNPEGRTWQYSKSVPELRYDPMLSMPMEEIVSTDEHHANKEETSMRSSVSQNEKLQLNENQKAHEPLMIRLDMTNHPEDLKWPFSKSVPELPYDPMLSMPSDNVEITNEHHYLNEGNMRLSQNQNERTQLDENHGLLEFLPTKLGDARLSQTQNERQQIYFNHPYEPHSTRLDFKNNFKDDSLAANKLRFNYIHNPTKEQTAMRLSQNQNDNTEVQYPSASFGLSSDMNRDDNLAHVTNDFISVAQPHHLHENRNPMLRFSNERQYLSHNFKTLPEYKMLPQTSEFELSNGQDAHNEHINMRTNQKQSRDPEPMENQYIHNSHLMRWNTENLQDHSPNTFKSNLDFDHTLHKSNEFGNEEYFPHEASKTVNTLEYRTRPQLFSDHNLDDTQSGRWFQTKQHNDHFANYYKTVPEVQDEYSNPHFREHLRKVAVNHRLNDADTFTSHDYPSSRARLHDHMQKYHQEMSSNTDSSMERGMHMSMREPFAKSDTEFNKMQFNHPHGTPRFGAALPIAGVSPGAVGVYPTGNAGGCGIPLLLSCSPSVISGNLARPNIVGPIFKSVDENFKYYIKRDAKNIEDLPDIKGQKALLPHSHGTRATHEVLK